MSGVPGGLAIEGLEIGEIIGAGAWADVHAAVRLSTGEPVAVKVLRQRTADDDVTVRRTMQEARLSWLLDHPNVVRILDWGLHPSRQVYIVMERLRGETVEARLARTGPLGVSAVMELARGVVLGLKAIHQRAIHRDIKPSNLFFCQGLSDHRAVKILDLGIAWMPKDDPERLVQTSHGEVVGTPAYAPPERFRGVPADARTDLYSLGAVLFECLTGQPPYAGGPMQVAVQVCRATSAPVLTRADTPDGLRALVARLLHPDAAQRPADADEVLAALTQLEERQDIDRWAVIHHTGKSMPQVKALGAESFIAAVAATVLEHFHPDHVPPEVKGRMEHISELTLALQKSQEARDAALAAAARLGRDLQTQSDDLQARKRSAQTSVAAQRSILEQLGTRLHQACAELDEIDAVFAARCAAFDEFSRDAAERASSLAEPVETGGRLGAQAKERLAELDGLAARRARLSRAAQKLRGEIERARAQLGERMGAVGQLSRALSAVEAEMSSTLFLRESEARALAEQAERLHLDRQHARLAIGLSLQRELFA